MTKATLSSWRRSFSPAGSRPAPSPPASPTCSGSSRSPSLRGGGAAVAVLDYTPGLRAAGLAHPPARPVEVWINPPTSRRPCRHHRRSCRPCLLALAPSPRLSATAVLWGANENLMGRRAKPAKGGSEAKRPLVRKTPKDKGAKVRDLEQRLAEALKREAEALEQQTATAEILRVISSSPTDVEPVFETILARAVRLCGAEYANLFRFDGERQHFVTGYNTPAAMREAHSRQYPMVPARGRMSGRAILERRVVHVPDLLAEPEYQGSTAVVGGFRSNLAVPMMLEGEPIGVIVINRMEPGPFSDKQISVVATFADQAVIAIENVRLFKELQGRNRDLTEALGQQTATSEILRVISSSPTDVPARVRHDHPERAQALRGGQQPPDDVRRRAAAPRRPGQCGIRRSGCSPAQVPPAPRPRRSGRSGHPDSRGRSYPRHP